MNKDTFRGEVSFLDLDHDHAHEDHDDDDEEAEDEPLEKDALEFIEDPQTPPSTPPEMEPGKAGCRLFRDVKHYVAPCYQDPDYRRKFTVKLIMANLLTYVPIVIVLICVNFLYVLDYNVLGHAEAIYLVFGLFVVVKLVSTYFVGLCRNWPVLHIAVGIRTFVNTMLFVMFMLLIHLFFLKISGHPATAEEEHNGTMTLADHSTDEENTEKEFHLDHPPPYMIILVVLLIWLVEGTFCYLIFKLKFPINDYRFPFIIYTTCYSISAVFATIALNNAFGPDPAYDLFQIVAGCFLASMILMRTPTFLERLYEGKVCPLREGELLYALIHYGL